MLGVVLWSDSSDNKAVIWCEDQGNLAYYKGSHSAQCALVGIDPGDLIQFDLTEDRHLRYASNPKRISENLCPTLAEDLQNLTRAACAPEPAPRRSAFHSAQIIPFKQRATHGDSELALG